MPSNKKRPESPGTSARTAAAFLVLTTSILMFLIDHLDQVLFAQEIDLGLPAWMLLAVAVTFFFGTSLKKHS